MERKFLDNGGFEYIKAFETEFDCAGLCKLPLFYMSRPIADGPPTNTCIKAVTVGMQDKLGSAGTVALITGLAMLVGMVGACPLCTGFSEDK